MSMRLARRSGRTVLSQVGHTAYATSAKAAPTTVYTTRSPATDGAGAPAKASRVTTSEAMQTLYMA